MKTDGQTEGLEDGYPVTSLFRALDTIALDFLGRMVARTIPTHLFFKRQSFKRRW